MPEVERKGQQIRIRVRNPKGFVNFRTHDVGEEGRLHRIAGQTRSGVWATQAWRINMKNYEDFNDVIEDLAMLASEDKITLVQYDKAIILADKWFR